MFPGGGGGGGHGDGDGAAGKMAMQLVERTEPGDIDAIVNCGGGGRPDRWGSPSVRPRPTARSVGIGKIFTLVKHDHD